MRGDGRVFQRGSSWWIAFYAHGEKQREPARVPDANGVLRPEKNEAEARRALRVRRSEVLGGRFIGRAEKVTVGELLDGCVLAQENGGKRSVRTTTLHLKPVRLRVGSWPVVG